MHSLMCCVCKYGGTGSDSAVCVHMCVLMKNIWLKICLVGKTFKVVKYASAFSSPCIYAGSDVMCMCVYVCMCRQ